MRENERAERERERERKKVSGVNNENGVDVVNGMDGIGADGD